VARYLSDHFVAAHQQVGAFQVIDESGRLVKTGGNVATYFTTPEGRVIHAVLGPVAGGELLAEARWAVDLYQHARADGGELATPIVLAHRDAFERSTLTDGPATSRRVHEFFAEHSLPRLEEVYQEIFTRILGQALGRGRDEIRRALAAIDQARRAQLPILFILHRERENRAVLDRWNALIAHAEPSGVSPMADLAANYVVIVLPLSELAELSQSLNVRPFAAPDRGTPVFVVARSDGRQLTALTTWSQADAPLVKAMAQGLVQAAKEHPRTAAQLRRLGRLVLRVDLALAEPVRELLEDGR
jgi:hypothetical protein